MITFDEFLEKYDFYKKGSPSLDFIRDVKEGDVLRKGHGLSYVIDSLDAVDELNDSTGMFNFKGVYESFSKGMQEIKELFGDKKVIPFSESFKKKLGECMEKSVATYLLFRNSNTIQDQLIVNGSSTDNLDKGCGEHTYNLVKNQGEWYVLDNHNPVSLNKFIPYLAKVKGVELKSGLPLKLEEQVKTTRVYNLL